MHWLRKDDTDQWAVFVPYGDLHVHVYALFVGQYIDELMPVARARAEYRALLNDGWQKITEDERKAAQMDLHCLKCMIYN